MRMEPIEVRGREEYLRQLDEQERAKGDRRFKNGAEMLQAFRDLFDSDEEMEAFADLLEQLREEERARYRD
jgi:hypothetical protein